MLELIGTSRKVLTLPCSKPQDTACVKAASSDKPPPLTFFPLGKNCDGFHSQTTIKDKNYIMKILLFVAFTVVCFALSPTAHAVVPPPDGGYPGGNTAEGQNALLSLTTGSYNTGVGLLSLSSNTTTSLNTAIGAGALLANTANQNTATGAVALFHNTVGSDNTANGAFALFSNTIGGGNTANGVVALNSNTSGVSNTANGLQALVNNTAGSENTATGAAALVSNTTGSGNTALGFTAGLTVTTASNVICIGTGGANVDNTCFIGNIRGVTTQNNDAIPVLIDSAGQLGTASSSRRFKKEIKPMDKASEAILALKPVSFHYKAHKGRAPQFGLIAEEVAEVNPDLVIYDTEGKPFTVRYDAVNAMLLNEFLKAHRKIEEQEQTMFQLKSRMDALTATVKEQAAQIQKVSAQIELSKAAPQVSENNQ